MSVRVGDLVSQLRDKSRVVHVRMGDVRLIHEGDNAGALEVADEYFPWGERNTQMLASFLEGPGYKYLLREPLGWQAEVIKHHTDRLADNETLWHIEGTNIGGIYHPEDKVLPLVSVAERLANVFDPDDRADVLYSPDQVEINVISDRKTVTVPGIEGVADRPLEGTVEYPGRRMKVGDLSAGGVRVIIQPSKPERAPSVQELWWRCYCENQSTRLVAGSQINLRGRTVPEILTELENVARTVFESLEASGHAILHSAETPVPAANADFIRQVARERGINASTVLRLQEQAASLREGASVYEVSQILTAMANLDGLPVVTRRNLQMIGGDLTLGAHAVTRCRTCAKPAGLVAA